MSKLKIPTAGVFLPLLKPSRTKGIWGGRGGGKSHFFAGLMIEEALRNPSFRGVCIREVQKSLKQSAKLLLEDKLQSFGLGEQQGFKVFREVIETPHDGLITFTGMQDHTADSVKSMENISVAWVEEAQSLSARSLALLRPTIRKENSELWFGWNPMRANDPVDMMLRGKNMPTDSIVVKCNWNENPWLPKVLEQERKDCLSATPEQYGHIWEGEYATVLEGAYFAKGLTEAQLENRIGFVAADPIMKIYAAWDIGGSSNRSDATSIWIFQFIGTEIRLLNYYEAVGQPFEAHVNWLRDNGYEKATCLLPHDGRKHDTVFSVTPEGYLRTAGFNVDVVKNQGAGAAIQRIEAVRQLLPSCRFNAETTEGGREALGWYHEKRDPVRGIGLGPNHDWSSHSADSFGLIAIYQKSHTQKENWKGGPIKRGLKGIV